MAETTRVRRTEAEKAQAVLDTAKRQFERLEKQRNELSDNYKSVNEKLAEVAARIKYLAANPALKAQDSNGTPVQESEVKPSAPTDDPFGKSATGDPFEF